MQIAYSPNLTDSVIWVIPVRSKGFPALGFFKSTPKAIAEYVASSKEFKRSQWPKRTTPCMAGAMPLQASAS
jgi:hypothetical protein